MSDKCWASVVDGCAGDITREHLISRCLSEKTVLVRGFKWCSTELKRVGVDSLTSHCLCDGHNNRLSPFDNEAKNAQAAMAWFAAALASPDNRIADGRFVHGPKFAKWCAKTACNLQAAEGKHVPLPFARYAFNPLDDPSIRLYLLLPFQDMFEVDSSQLSVRWLHREGHPDDCLVLFMFYGLWVVLSSIDAKGMAQGLMAGFGLPAAHSVVLMDRTRWLYGGPGPRLKKRDRQRVLRFLWGNDLALLDRVYRSRQRAGD